MAPCPGKHTCSHRDLCDHRGTFTAAIIVESHGGHDYCPHAEIFIDKVGVLRGLNPLIACPCAQDGCLGAALNGAQTEIVCLC